MSGLRLGFTYAAALLLIGLLVAMIAVPEPVRSKPATGTAKPLPPGFFQFTAAPARAAKAPPSSPPRRRPS